MKTSIGSQPVRVAPLGKFSNKDRDDSWFPVDEFVDKPIQPKDLLEKVTKILGA